LLLQFKFVKELSTVGLISLLTTATIAGDLASSFEEAVDTDEVHKFVKPKSREGES
jgi:hypothetical protein